MQLENIKNTARRNGYDLALIIYYGFIVSLGAVRFPLSVFQISCLSFSFITVFLTQIAFTHFALCMLSWQFFLCLFFFFFLSGSIYSIVVLGSRSSGILLTWPNQLFTPYFFDYCYFLTFQASFYVLIWDSFEIGQGIKTHALIKQLIYLSTKSVLLMRLPSIPPTTVLQAVKFINFGEKF